MTSITIPNSVTEIGDYAFANCDSITSVTIPDSVTVMGVGAFQGCDNLQVVIMGTGVTYVSSHEFEGCTALTSVTIGSNVTLIDDSAFENCTSLSSITIPNSVTTIGENAFKGCTSLNDITIPSGVTTIDSGAFSGCTSMTSITVDATTPPSLAANAFNNTNNCRIYVPCSSLNAYKAASGWSAYENRIWGHPSVSGIALNKNVMQMFKGKTYTLVATILPNDACTKDVVWTTSNNSIISVTQSGTITSKALGEAIITATSVEGGFTATCVVTVNDVVIHVESVELNKNETTLAVGETETLTATVLPETATDKSVT